jgi:PhnB protein
VQLNPYVSFNGNCEEAVTFYRDALGGELSIMRYEGSPMEEGLSPDDRQKVMHARLETRGGTIMASDVMPGHQRNLGDNISLSISIDEPDQAESVFSKLSADGQITMPMEDQFWGAKFGMLVDKYGINWMINCDTAASQS